MTMMDATLPHVPAMDLAAEANHRIANSLTLLVSMVRMQASAIAKNPAGLSSAHARLLLDGIAARISTIGQLHRLLSHAPRDGMVNLRSHLHEVTDALVAALSSPEQMVRVERGAATAWCIPARCSRSS
jgi:two-component sensor histidine kinase